MSARSLVDGKRVAQISLNHLAIAALVARGGRSESGCEMAAAAALLFGLSLSGMAAQYPKPAASLMEEGGIRVDKGYPVPPAYWAISQNNRFRIA